MVGLFYIHQACLMVANLFKMSYAVHEQNNIFALSFRVGTTMCFSMYLLCLCGKKI